ncbi:Crp/Fnr family transcriptional regulator [soil metagenome]
MAKKIEKLPCETCHSRKFSLFNEVAEAHLCQLSADKNYVFYKKGQTLFYEGTRPLGLFCINEGAVKVYKSTPNGKEQILRLSKPGDFLGYRALLGEEHYAASATILEDAKICFILKESFLHLLSTDSNLYRKLMKAICHEVGLLEEKVTELSQKSVRERLAHTLLMLKETYGIDGDANSQKIDIALPREDLASIVGTATETVIRLLSEFKNDGFIDFEGKKIKILDSKALAKTSNCFA